MFSRPSSSRHSKCSGCHSHSRSNADHSRGGRSRDLINYGSRDLGGRNSERKGCGLESRAMLDESPFLRQRQDLMQELSHGLGRMRLGGLDRMDDTLGHRKLGGRGFASAGVKRLGAPPSRGLRNKLDGLDDRMEATVQRGRISGLRGMAGLGGTGCFKGMENMQQQAIDPRLPYGLEQGYDVNDVTDQQQGLLPLYSDPHELYTTRGYNMEDDPMPLRGGLGIMAGGPRGGLLGGLWDRLPAGRRERLFRDSPVDLGGASFQSPDSRHPQPGRVSGSLGSPLHSLHRSPLRSPQPSLRDGQVRHPDPWQQRPQEEPPHQHSPMNYRTPYVEEYDGLSDQDIQDIMSTGGVGHHFWGPDYGDTGGYDGYEPSNQGGHLRFEGTGGYE
jgi:hypothetical protein